TCACSCGVSCCVYSRWQRSRQKLPLMALFSQETSFYCVSSINALHASCSVFSKILSWRQGS
ncbi:hypothetical protein DFQ26_000326, partial [Actinomortierella ambigua]